jgi:hypothetical protein
MMRKTFVSLALLGLVVCLLVPSVLADWVQVSVSSGWSVDRCSWSQSQSGDSLDGYWRFLNVSEFLGYEANVNFSFLVNARMCAPKYLFHA